MRPTLDFGAGHEMEPRALGSVFDSMQSAQDSLSAPLSAPPPLAHTIPLKIK